MRVRHILGADIDRELLPVLAVSLVTTAAMSAMFGFQGIYAIRELGASPSTFAWALLVESGLVFLTGYAGGHLSDRLGRKPVMLAGAGGEAVALAALALSGDRFWLGLGLIVLAGALGSPGRAAAQALVADMVPQARHEQAYAAARVVENLGVTIGPPAAGLILLADSWSLLFGIIAACMAAAVWLGLGLIPDRPPHAAPRREAGTRTLALIRADHAFLLFLAASVFASLAFIASETVLPIAAVTVYGLSPSAWGVVAVLNPVSVVLLQLRITAWTAWVPAVRKLLLAMLLMGGSLMLLPLDGGLPLIVAVIVLFVLGEMLWVPSSQAIITRLAPARLRGAYMGAFASTGSVAFALGPLAGLQLLDRAGDAAMWAFYAVGCCIAGITGAAAARRAEGRTPDVPDAPDGHADSSSAEASSASLR